MQVLAATSRFLRARLARGVPYGFELRAADTWSEAIELMLSEPVEVAVLDPALEGETRTHEIERFRTLFPSSPVILYAKLTEALAPLLLRLGGIGIRQLMLAWHDDHPSAITRALSSELERSLSHQLIGELRPKLPRFPADLWWVVEAALRNPASVPTVNALAERAEMTRRTCLRKFSRAGLPNPSLVLTTLRVLYGHRLLLDPGYAVEDVARKLGYSTSRTFAKNVKEILNLTPAEVRVSLDPETALSIACQRLTGAAQADDDLSRRAG